MKNRDALFDFDDEFDNLSAVSEKYAVDQKGQGVIEEGKEVKREAVTPVVREKRDIKETLKNEAIMELTIKKSKTRPKIHKDNEGKSSMIQRKRSIQIRQKKLKVTEKP